MRPRTLAEERVQEVLRNPDRDALGAIRRLPWTGHNIPLTLSESTLPGASSVIGDDPRTLLIKRLIRRFVGEKPTPRIVDLGSLEGGLSFELAREGWDVTGVEGRRVNHEKADAVGRYFGLGNLRFELRDVKTLDPARDGRFDAVVCCGLLYHLDDPFGFLRTLRRITAEDGLLFVDTHVAPEQPERGPYAAQLSEPVTIVHEEHAYEGRWFAEPAAGSLLDQQWSAVSNERSFWPTHRSLVRAVYHAGFPLILDLHGMFDIDGEFALRDTYSRVWLACPAL